MKWMVALMVLAGGCLLAGDQPGIRPRPDVNDYPAHRAGAGITVAAAVIPPEQVSKLFSTDLNRAGYLVMEVAVYPEPGRNLDLKAADFVLRIGSESATVRPVSGGSIASIIQKKNSPKPRQPGDVTLYPTATVGYESGTYNGQRHGGVYTGAGVGVGVGNPGPTGPPPAASTPQDRATMRQELEDKGLPEGPTTRVVAGYLYFPRPSAAKRSSAPYNLTFYAPDGQVFVPVPQPAKK